MMSSPSTEKQSNVTKNNTEKSEAMMVPVYYSIEHSRDDETITKARLTTAIYQHGPLRKMTLTETDRNIPMRVDTCTTKDSDDKQSCRNKRESDGAYHYTSKSGDTYEPIKKLAMVQIQPPRNPNKPFTSFSITDILSEKRKPTRPIPLDPRNFLSPSWDSYVVSPEFRHSYSLLDSDDEDIIVDDDPPPKIPAVSPLDALFKMANKTFEGLEDACSDGTRKDRESLQKGNNIKKRRKSRTAFSNQQIYELEKRFLYQKYLTPADRDDIAQNLGLTNAQVITWFQNRRAKLKRDLEELKADVTAARVITGDAVSVTPIMLEKVVETGLTQMSGNL